MDNSRGEEMAKEFVFSEKQKGIAIISMSNDGKKNALCFELLSVLYRTLQEMEQDTDIRTIILTGHGDNFCSGMDVEWLLREDAIGIRKSTMWIQEIFSYIEHYKKPIIAALNGATLGAGFILALICDLRIASENTLLGLPEIKIGIPIFLGGPKILQRYLGMGKIKELLFSGKLIDAHKGLEMGLINQVTSVTELMTQAIGIAQEISAFSPIALEMLKKSLNVSYEMSDQALLSYELDSLGFYWGTEDRKEGFKSFLEKRKPLFKGY